MKSPHSILVALLVLFGSKLVLLAQTDPSASGIVPLPPGPWPARTADMSSWTITIKQKSEADSSNAQPDGASSGSAPAQPKSSRQIAVVKTWPIVHEVETQTFNKQGKTWDKWFTKGIEVIPIPGTKTFFTNEAGTQDPFLFHDYLKSDFGGFEWVSQNTYQSVSTYDGHKCYFFKGLMQIIGRGQPTLVTGNPGPVPPYASRFDVKAYLDFKTLMPVELEWGDEVRTYKFNAPPEAFQTLPENVSAVLAERAQKIKAAQIAPDRPY